MTESKQLGFITSEIFPDTIIRIRGDVILTRICDEFLLVSTKTARDTCPNTQHINKSAAFIWKKLENGSTIEDLTNEVMKHYHIPAKAKDQVQLDIIHLISGLQESGYLVFK